MLSSSDYEKIGKRFKLENPGRWDENTDLEVGVVAVKKGLVLAPDYGGIEEVKTSRWRSPEGRLEQHDTQVFDRRVGEQEQLAHLTQYTAVQNFKNLNTVTELATERRVSAATSEAMEMAEHTSKVKVNEHRQMTEVDINKAERLEDNRLKAYDRETKIDYEAALRLANDREGQLDIARQKLAGLLQARDDIKRSDKPPDLKAPLLQAQDKAIKFQEQYIGQLERHLLEAADGQDVRGAQSKTESRPAVEPVHSTRTQ